MIKLASAIIISSTIPTVDYSPSNKYVIDGDYSDTIREHYPQLIRQDDLTDLLYKTLIEEIERGQHGPIRHGE
jgi:hypothetical protein